MTTTIAFPHPGETIRLDYLEPLGMSANALSLALDVPPMRINLIVRGQRSITADTALRLARYLGTTPQFWLNLQTEYDLRQAETLVGAEVELKIQPLETQRPRSPTRSMATKRRYRVAAAPSRRGSGR
ncbi:MAG: HigA family addiction module antidote protein [Planctomycetes bacterium]|nr:HigA family addiction module antidote protein [Planctomycetota bacterium]